MRFGFFGRLGGVLVQPRATLRRVAAGEGGVSEVLACLVILLFVGEAVRVGTAIAAAPYLGFGGVASQLLGILGGAVPDLLVLFVAAALMALLARRKGRELDVAACALVPWLALRLVAQLLVTGLWVYTGAIHATLGDGAKLAIAGVSLLWGGVVWVLGLLELRRLPPDAPTPLGRSSVAAGTLLVGGLLALAALKTTWLHQHRSTLRPAGTAGEAPDFTVPLLGGGTFHLRQEPRAVTLVDFWATWCGPCRQELPVIDRLAARYQGRARLVAVEVSGTEAIPDAGLIARQLGLSLPIAVTGDRASTLYHVNTLPHLVLVGRRGEIRRVFLGVHAESEISAALDAALAE